MTLTNDGIDGFWKNNRKGQQVESEVYLLKQAFGRVTKRLVLLENFIKYKFDGEFPPASSFDFVVTKVNVNNTNTSGLNKNSTASFLPKAKPPTSRTMRLFRAKGENKSNSIKTISQDVFLIDSKGQPIDWEKSNPHENDENEDHEMGVESEVVIDYKIDTGSNEVNEDNSDNSGIDQPPENDNDSDYECPDDPVGSESEVDIDKLAEDKKSLLWLHGENSNDFDYKPPKKGKTSQNNKASTPSRIFFTPRVKIDRSKDRRTCEICDKVFLGSQSKCNLKAHMDIHSAIKKYRCQICDKAFRQKRPLRGHMQRIHQRDQFAVHACQFCGKKFIAKKELEQHEATHTGEKKHTCEICGFRCVQDYYFKQHMDRHAGKKSVFLCPECGKSFNSKHRLKSHTKNIHEGEFGPDGKKLKTYTCEMCPSILVNPLGLKVHMKKIHGIKTDSTVKSNSQQQLPPLSKQDNEGSSEEAVEAVSSILPD